jgi:hypothetical protein
VLFSILESDCSIFSSPYPIFFCPYSRTYTGKILELVKKVISLILLVFSQYSSLSLLKEDIFQSLHWMIETKDIAEPYVT